MAKVMEIGSLKIRGLHDTKKRTVIYKQGKQLTFYLCCLQVTCCIVSNNAKAWKNKCYRSFSDFTLYSGISVLLSEKLKDNFADSYTDNTVQTSLLNTVMFKAQYSVINGFAQNTVYELCFVCLVNIYTLMYYGEAFKDWIS